MPVFQRLLVVAVIAGIVVGLIMSGCSPQLAVTVVSGIVLVSREVWTLGGRGELAPSRDRKPEDLHESGGKVSSDS